MSVLKRIFGRNRINEIEWSVIEVIAVFTATLVIGIAPLLVDGSISGFGWELPKVYFIQLAGLFYILILGTLALYREFSKKQVKLPRLIPYLIPVGLIILSIFRADYIRRSITLGGINPLYEKIYPLFGITESAGTPLVTVFGTVFRDQGAITILILLLFSYTLFYYLNKQNSSILFSGIAISALLQAQEGFLQYQELLENNPDVLEEGQSVFGTFGQTNFYAGFLLAGIGSIGYLILKHKSVLLKTYLLPIITILAIYLVFNLYVSYSEWGQLVLIFLVASFIISNISLPKPVYTAVIIAPILGLFALIPAFDFYSDYNPVYHRITIWNGIFEQYHPVEYTDRFILGTGPDTLIFTLSENEGLTNSIVDRAHNIFLDIFAQFGVIGLAGFFLAILYIAYRLSKKDQEKEDLFLYLVLMALLFRDSLHTSSIVNQVVTFVFILLVVRLNSNKTF